MQLSRDSNVSSTHCSLIGMIMKSLENMSTVLVQDLTLACLLSAGVSLGSSSGVFSLLFLGFEVRRL